MLILLAACTQPSVSDKEAPVDTDTAVVTDTGDTGEAPPEDLGDPYLGMVAAVSPGILNDTCRLRVDIYVDGEAREGQEVMATGGEWVGLPLSGDDQYSATGLWENCTDLNPSGTVSSGTFSGVAGSLFLFWYNGANAGYATLEQTKDYEGGRAEITLAAGADTTGIVAIAAANNVALTQGEGDVWSAGFPTDVPVGQVLAAFSADPAFVEGTPAWIDAPYWW
ncbi:MAG: hypothetical protein Q8P41_07555 [Pseudomonadota bacterium]|nr:hypothetical protein [Pseudomonadota bacterium]